MKKWSVLIALAAAQFVMVLDSTVMNVSISTVVKDLDTTVSALQSCITFYTLTMAAFMLIGAKLCSKWGLLKAFAIGSVVYGAGSLITALSPNIGTLFIGWSVIEGLGAILVIPAIAALIAVNYTGKDRVVAFAVIGGISGAAAAAGPLIGGFMTTYLSWRYVFAAETVVMLILLLFLRIFKSPPLKKQKPIDLASALYSILGMTTLVYGMLQSKVWGWVRPLGEPSIAGHDIAPFGISIVAYLIIIGVFVLKVFYNRQKDLESRKANPLLTVSLFSLKHLRAGLFVLMSQYVVTAAIFFIVPVYLQMIIGLDALQTGIKILPLSIALILFSVAGTRLVKRYSPKRIVRIGQVFLFLGTLFLLASINPELTGISYAIAMFALGAGLGLLASQLGNVNMSAVTEDKTSEVGGLQGTFQNLGSSFGTALIGSLTILALTGGFVNNIDNTNLPSNVKNYISSQTQDGVQIVPVSSVNSYALSKGLPANQAQEITQSYESAQLQGLKDSIFLLAALTLLSLMLSRNIPDKVLG